MMIARQEYIGEDSQGWPHAVGEKCDHTSSRIALLLLFPLFVSANTLAAEPKQIVLLHSYRPNFRTMERLCPVGFVQELEQKWPWPLDIQDFSVITARNRDQNGEAQFAEYLNALFSSERPTSLSLSEHQPPHLCNGTRPVYFPPRRWCLLLLTRDASPPRFNRERYGSRGAAEHPLLFGNILQLLPDTKTIAVLGSGNSPNERF